MNRTLLLVLGVTALTFVGVYLFKKHEEEEEDHFPCVKSDPLGAPIITPIDKGTVGNFRPLPTEKEAECFYKWRRIPKADMHMLPIPYGYRTLYQGLHGIW